MTPPRRDGTAGFTLLELLVSLALLALLLTALPAAMHMGRRAFASAAAVDHKASDLVTASFMRERVAAAMPLLERSGDGALRLAFRGEPHALAFVAPVVDGPLDTGLFSFEIAHRPDTTGRSGIMLIWRQYSADANFPAAERVLLADATAFDLRYFGYRSGAATREWGDTWSDPQSLPELVEVTLAAGSGPARRRVMVIPLAQREVP